MIEPLSVTIIGDGSFGTFLKKLFAKSDAITLTNNALIVILAVPLDAYDQVARQHKDKLLVNVCSVQSQSNDICLKYSADVLGLHPLFGARTSDSMDKICLATHRASDGIGGSLEESFLHVLSGLGIFVLFETDCGEPITAEWHDRLMAKSHLKALEIAEMVAPIFAELGVSTMYLPGSARKMFDLVAMLQDMPKGTRDSIMANKYRETNDDRMV